MITHLVTFGCSFTEGSEIGNIEYNFDETDTACSHRGNTKPEHYAFMQAHAWPQRLADRFGVTCLNYGKSGSDNKTIVETMSVVLAQLTKTIPPQNILVIVMWTEMGRASHYIRHRHMMIIPRYQVDSVKRFSSMHNMPIDSVSANLMDGINKFVVDHWCDLNNTVRDAINARQHGDILARYYGCHILHTQAMWEDPLWYGLQQSEWTPGYCNQDLERYFASIHIQHDMVAHGNCIADFVNGTREHSFGGFSTINGFPYGNGGHPLQQAHSAYADVLYNRILNLPIPIV